MKRLLFISCLGILFGACCDTIDMAEGVPVCITQKAIEFSQHTCPENTSVKEYEFQNENVFVFYEEECGADNNSNVLTAACDTIGYLGGFAGNRIIRGDNFDENAKYVRTIWEN